MEMQEFKNGYLEKIERRFIDLTTKDLWEKEKSFALQIFRKNPRILKCTPETILEAVMNVANIGLTLDPVQKLAYLIPRYDPSTRSMICVLEPSYQGLIKLVTDTGSVKSIQAQLVHEKDTFEVEGGTLPSIKHKLYLKEDRGEITHVYAVADIDAYNKQFEVMPISEIVDIRGRSESYKAYKDGKIKSTTWVTNFGEMARKTVIRRLVKYLPKTDKWEKVNRAIDLQEQDFKPSDTAIEYAIQLLWSSTYSPELKESLEVQIPMMSASEVSNTIANLKENQPDPIASGSNYSQKEIHEKLDKADS